LVIKFFDVVSVVVVVVVINILVVVLLVRHIGGWAHKLNKIKEQCSEHQLDENKNGLISRNIHMQFRIHFRFFCSKI